MTTIIDAHVHLFPEKLMQAIFRWFEQNEGWEMPYQWSAEKYIDYLAGAGITEFMVLAYAHKPGMSRGMNRWLADWADRYPQIRPYACVYQDDSDMEEMLTEFLDHRNFHGVKIHCSVQKVSAADKRFEPVHRLLAEREKGLVLHASSMPQTPPYVDPGEVERLLKDYPGMKIMVAHLGLPDFLHDYLKLVEQYDNLYLDTAFIFGNPLYQTDYLKDYLVAYCDKIIYGSDFPFLPYAPENSLRHLRSFNLGQEAEEKIFCRNARKFLGEGL